MPGIKTKPGALAPLMALRLVDLNGPAVEAWAKREAPDRPARVRLALRLLKAFLRWADAEPDLKGRVDPAAASAKNAREAAGLDGLTLHGLRRSFASLCEWLDIPGSISAQIQGHAPQGVRKQNYIRRPLDLLRVHHEKIEAWILEQAGVTFDAAAPAGLRVVA